jgi:hypothetical protein
MRGGRPRRRHPAQRARRLAGIGRRRPHRPNGPSWHGVEHRQWTDAGLAATNTLLGTYAILAFIGLRNSLVDIGMNVVAWLRPPRRAAPAPSRRSAPVPIARDTHLADWESILYLGANGVPAQSAGGGNGHRNGIEPAAAPAHADQSL